MSKQEVDRLRQELGQPPLPSLQATLEEKSSQCVNTHHFCVVGGLFSFLCLPTWVVCVCVIRRRRCRLAAACVSQIEWVRQVSVAEPSRRGVMGDEWTLLRLRRTQDGQVVRIGGRVFTYEVLIRIVQSRCRASLFSFSSLFSLFLPGRTVKGI